MKPVLLLKVEQLSILIRSLREQKGWSQAQLARELNTSQQAVSRMEKDASGLAFARVYEVLAVLDVQLVAESRRPFTNSVEGW
ncbi:MAG TPA: helix-turn-helix domain-containing protein [Candidatus Paenalcaligenes intestinipullorum]|uniref:Helix-turn-helix domain-containing protein n=1 Tax=Candidatus Paenalcaligenes intestinipullorum TaxID=2838718 RepID=A0A9D2U7W2_9BURK|nr:helix-turn-helix domain-containing protein [Candidatus Paenalcaligenes intestinipullorum]